MEIRLSTPDDIGAMMDMFENARRFMAASGNAVQWVGGYPQRELIEQDIAVGQSYVLTEGGELLATFVLQPGDEPTYQRIEGAWLNDLPYGTLHRVASSGKRGGVTDFIVRWAWERTHNLRGDTHALNLPMQRAFERNGFVRCGTVWMANGTPRIAYHKIK